MPPRVPTVNDLRVKLCYICREEERTDDEPLPAGTPARAWTHPCSCTLIAHEACLLKWIQSSQTTAARAPNALKCPQCGTAYEMESENTVVLRFLAVGNRVLQRMGRYFTVGATAVAVGVVGTSIYVCLTAYGAWAVQKFIGDEMYNIILTDDPVNWPWSAYINLPLLPLALILSRFKNSSSSIVVPLLLVWPPSAPVGDAARRLFEYWAEPEHSSFLRSLTRRHGAGWGLGLGSRSTLWPPPPMFFGLIGFPLLRALYKRAFAQLYYKLLGTPLPPPRRLPRAGLRFNEGPFVIRIRAQFDEAEGQDEAERAQAEAHNRQVAQEDAAAAAAEAAVLGRAAINNGDGEGANGANAPGENPDPNAAAVEAAEQLIEVDASSLGRRIGGALIVPAIASAAGNALLALSRYSHWLRVFLGVRESGWAAGRMPLPPWGGYALAGADRTWAQLGVLQQVRMGLRLGVSAVLGGSQTWVDSDPVWWRNGVGFALFIAAKDCIQLLHLWLAKREFETRRVKDRDFTGVDIRELDLLNPEAFRG